MLKLFKDAVANGFKQEVKVEKVSLVDVMGAKPSKVTVEF